MFKNEYQGGPFVEIFSAQGKDPTAKWKLFGSQSAIWKDFDKEVKSFVFILEGSSQTNKMQLPKENKQTLGLIQRYLILQVHVPLGQDFSTELLITDLGSIKRRLYLSTVHKELSATPLHAKIPLLLIKRKMWCNLCIDLVAFTSGVFKGAVFQSLDGIIVSANCKLRKIFTMKLKPQDTLEEDDTRDTPCSSDEPTDGIPRSCQFTTDVLQVTQLLDMTKMRQSEVKRGQPLASTDHDMITNRGPGSSRSTKNPDSTHIAFGSKVTRPPLSTGRTARASSETGRSLGVRSDRSTQQPFTQKSEDIATVRDNMAISPLRIDEPSYQKNKENIHQMRRKATSSVLDQSIIQPHPPQDASSDRVSIRKLRVRSAGKDGSEIHNGRCTPADEESPEPCDLPCERVSDAEPLKDDRPPQQPASQADEWIFPDRLPPETSKQRMTYDDQPFRISPQNLKDEQHRENQNPSCNLQSDQKEVYMYSSRPRSAPHRKSPNVSVDDFTFQVDVGQIPRLEDQRGARMEDDFYGSGSSEEEELSHLSWVQSPLGEQEVSPSAEVAKAQRRTTLKNVECEDSIIRHHKEVVSSIPLHSDLEGVQRSPLLPHGLSVTGSRPAFSQETPSISRTLKEPPRSQVQTSRSRRSLKEIPREDARLTSGYDWRNYQPGRLSTSELQMLASLKRQQKEEFEEDGISHGLSASQIDNCNVSISTSSDDTTTWNSCLPPPVTQGRHYEEEMRPLSRSNPRDWSNAFSPPITAPSHQLEEQMDSVTLSRQLNLSDNSQGEEDFGLEEDEEVLTLLYDPCLNCYFDPDTGKYYELA